MSNFTVIGKGGREHALATLLVRTCPVYSFGASGAIRDIAPALDPNCAVALDRSLEDEDLKALLSQPDSVIVFGPEQPMAAGWVDQIRLQNPNARIIGPNQFCAQLETSKWWAKEFMIRNSIPTGEAARLKSIADFDRCTLRFEPPYVIKADGLAAGKGVALFNDVGPARKFVDGITNGSLFGAPQTALIEEFLAGPELSIFLLLDGSRALQIGTARDYKRAYDQDAGPNTGGMGSFTPVPDVSDADQEMIHNTVLRPILEGLQRDGIFYRGFLYVGLIRTRHGFRVLEFNVRMGDPETQAVLPVIGDDLPVLLEWAGDGCLDQSRTLSSVQQVSDHFYRLQSQRAAVCVVLSTPEYPASGGHSQPLSGLSEIAADLPPDQYIFHAGTRQQGAEWWTHGGRVLNVVATGGTVQEARDRSYALVERLRSLPLRHRSDIAAER